MTQRDQLIIAFPPLTQGYAVKKLYLALPVCALLLQGCGVTMTRYEPDFQNVQQLKQNAPLQPVRDAQVNADSGQVSLIVRLNPISSPEGSVPLLPIQADFTRAIPLTSSKAFTASNCG